MKTQHIYEYRNTPLEPLSPRCETPGLELIGERLDGRGDTSAPATPSGIPSLLGGQMYLSFCSGTPEVPPPAEDQPPPRGVGRINTLWGSCIQVKPIVPLRERASSCPLQKYAKMCIPDLDVLVDYPIDYKWVQSPSSYQIVMFVMQVSNILQIRLRGKVR